MNTQHFTSRSGIKFPAQTFIKYACSRVSISFQAATTAVLSNAGPTSATAASSSAAANSASTLRAASSARFFPFPVQVQKQN